MQSKYSDFDIKRAFQTIESKVFRIFCVERLLFVKTIIFVLLFSLVILSCRTQNKGLDKLIDGQWFVVDRTDTLWMGYGSIHFDSEDHTYGEYDGCNWSSGEYYYVGNKIVFEDAPSTAIACPCFGKSGLPGPEPANVEKIRFFDTDGIAFTNDLPTFSYFLRQGKWMLKGTWEVVEIDGKNVSEEGITMSFDNRLNTVSVQESGVAVDLSFTVNKQTHISFLPGNVESSSKSKTLNSLINLLKTVTDFSPSSGFLECSLVISLENAKKETVVELQRTTERFYEGNDSEE